MDKKRNTRIKQLIFKELLEIVELWPDKTMTQHLCTIMRPYSEAYHWNDEMLLKKVEKYRYELETDEDDEPKREDN